MWQGFVLFESRLSVEQVGWQQVEGRMGGGAQRACTGWKGAG